MQLTTLNRDRTRESGNAMVISLLVLMVLTAIGLAHVTQAKTETQIAGNTVRGSQALFNAEAGIAEGLARLNSPADTANFIGQPVNTVTPGWGMYLVDQFGSSTGDPNRANLGADGLDNDLDGTVDESGESYPETKTKQIGSNTIPYPWVKVEYRTDAAGQVVLFGDHDDNVVTPQIFNLVKGSPVMRVTSEGQRGNALRRVEVEAVRPSIDLVRTAVYSEDDDFKFNGTQFLISGDDWDPVTGGRIPGASQVPGISTIENPENIKDALAGNQTDNVEGSGGVPSVTTSPVDLDLHAMFDGWGPSADIVVPSGTYSNINWGDFDNYNIVRVDGDLHASGNVSGGGILLIDGNFTCTGSFTWYGLVICLGDMSFSGGGAGVHIYGSLMLEGNIDKQTMGGNADIMYSSAALDRLAGLGSYQVVAWREF